MIKENKKELIICLLAVACLILSGHNYNPAAYIMMGLKVYHIFLVLFLIITIIAMTGPLKKFKKSFSLLLMWSGGFSLVEVIYTYTSYLLPPEGSSLWMFIVTFYQYIGIIILFLAFYSNKESFSKSFLKPGNLKEETKVLGYKEAIPWYMVVLRFFIAFISCFVIFLIIRKAWANCSIASLKLFIPILLASLSIGLAEEILCRGIFLGVFLQEMSERKANILQAFLFGLLHWPSHTFLFYLQKVLLFTFLGWFFGRAAMETKGILPSFIMHSTIIVGLNATMYLFGVPAF
ncbi:MAG TPA: type II CAAX endopeptidase family protein [Candidatus Eremiobacteraeota bacterium]|nr:MAG: CAAX amino terminal protease self- immunity [bacterium ADurb.Bin363]HPZ09544.1 type II CAAX endopeptidase family protein [Candidatus Eremiobacteraeota bacterium]